MLTKQYKIEIHKSVIKDLEKIPVPFRKAIKKKIDNLVNDPRPEGYKKLQGLDVALYRIRCGDYRIVYSIKDDILLVLVLEIGHRRNIYRDL